jgi:hypothetical protein
MLIIILTAAIPPSRLGCSLARCGLPIKRMPSRCLFSRANQAFNTPPVKCITPSLHQMLVEMASAARAVRSTTCTATALISPPAA